MLQYDIPHSPILLTKALILLQPKAASEKRSTGDLPSALSVCTLGTLCKIRLRCTAWRPRGLSKSVISRVIIRVTPFRVLITLLLTHLLSPLGLQVSNWPTFSVPNACEDGRGQQALIPTSNVPNAREDGRVQQALIHTPSEHTDTFFVHEKGESWIRARLNLHPSLAPSQCVR